MQESLRSSMAGVHVVVAVLYLCCRITLDTEGISEAPEFRKGLKAAHPSVSLSKEQEPFLHIAISSFFSRSYYCWPVIGKIQFGE